MPNDLLNTGIGKSNLFGRTVEEFLNASPIGQDRLIRKEVSLGQIREIEPPMEHLGLQLCPWLDVPTDDVIFQYITGETDGLAPARAEDAESELAQKDETSIKEGRASLIDWSLKDHYDPSDVSRWRELSRMIAQLQSGTLPLYVTSALEDWSTKLSRDAARRRRKLDNRVNWLIMSALADSVITYNDGKIKFTVDYGRPAAQKASNAANDIAAASITDGVVNWSSTTHDPIGQIKAIREFMEDLYQVEINRAIVTKKILRRVIKSDKFAQLAGLGTAWAAGVAGPPDPNYLIQGWGQDAAVTLVENATGVKFILDDSVYRTRPIGSNTVTNNRFWPEGRMLFLPDPVSLAQVDDTEIGFGRTLSSPHPEGNWTSGFYEWEKEDKDPWGIDRGTGVKAFPVFPHMEYTYAVTVTT